jgi:hypothetical protein
MPAYVYAVNGWTEVGQLAAALTDKQWQPVLDRWQVWIRSAGRRWYVNDVLDQLVNMLIDIAAVYVV